MKFSNKTDSIEKQSLPGVPGKENKFARLLYITCDPNGTPGSLTSLSSKESSDCSGTSKARDQLKNPSDPSYIVSPLEYWPYTGYRQEILDQMTEEFSLVKKESVLLPKLMPDEIEFLELVAENNVTAVEEYCKTHQNLNINCVTFQGTSALHIAVKNRSEPMVEFLLMQPNIEIGDTVMHAIRENTIKNLVKLLDFQKRICPGLEFMGSTHSPDFPEHMTPLILAGHTGNYEVVALLVNRGHTIPQPHSPSCLCGECKKSLETDDTLQASKARLDSYRAICAPAYLVHASSDPILAAFRLTEELTAQAAACRQQAGAYLQLRDQVSAFAVDLIGCCRTSLEVEQVLKQVCCQSYWQFQLPRLVMAVDYRQKEFVAHPNTQLVLQSYWLGNWFSWKSKSLLSKGFAIISRVFIMPLILFMCVVAPRHRLINHYQVPLNKLITHTTGYFLFLALVFYISNQDKTGQKRGPPTTGAETPLMLFVLGYAWSAIRMLVVQGPKRYFSYAWNVYDLATLMLFGLTFAVWVAATKSVKYNYHEETERKYWDQYDPTLVAEGTFCLAAIFAYFRLLSLFQLNYHLGPLLVSLRKMTVDIYHYFKVYAIIICAFAVGLARFYQYYEGMVHMDKAGMITAQVSSFITLPDTLKTLFWALFCMSPLESADVVLDNRYLINNVTTRHAFTERIGYFCFGCFEVISVIVVLNMLIATMSNTYQRVINNVATEWTFGTTEMYLNYMCETTLPSPYNLVPTLGGLRSAAEWVLARTRRSKPSRHRNFCNGNCGYIDCDGEARANIEYAALMSVLVQRYFRAKRFALQGGNKEAEEELVTLRRELSSLKAFLQNHKII